MSGMYIVYMNMCVILNAVLVGGKRRRRHEGKRVEEGAVEEGSRERGRRGNCASVLNTILYKWVHWELVHHTKGTFNNLKMNPMLYRAWDEATCTHTYGRCQLAV